MWRFDICEIIENLGRTRRESVDIPVYSSVCYLFNALKFFSVNQLSDVELSHVDGSQCTDSSATAQFHVSCVSISYQNTKQYLLQQTDF